MAGKKPIFDPSQVERHAKRVRQLYTQQLKEARRQAEEEAEAAMRARVFVCSDIHLGTNDSRSVAFYAWLDERQKGDTAILLGDILDMWIYDGDYLSGDLEAVVADQWGILWDKLREVQKRGVEIHYIPGNHDTFAFYIEAEPFIPWCATVLKKSGTFRRIRDATATKRLIEVASIHYPFFELGTGTGNRTRLLFTHGHFHQWGWKLTSALKRFPNPVDEAFGARLGLSGLSIAVTHGIAQELRLANNFKDKIKSIWDLEDTSFAITNAVLNAYDAALASDPDRAFDVIKRAMNIYFSGNPPPRGDTEGNKIAKALKKVKKRREPKLENRMRTVRHQTIRYVKKNPSVRNVRLTVSPSTTANFERFDKFLTPDWLVFGHFHEHVIDHVVKAVDIGAYYDREESSLAVRPDGSFIRPDKKTPR